jgi:hypothetical protein
MMERRREQLAAALAAWRDAGRSAENDQLLADWLRATIRNSMPGSRKPLPEVPSFAKPFAAPTSIATPSAASQPAPRRTPTTRQKPVVGSAGDDSNSTQISQSAPAVEESPRAQLPWDHADTSTASESAVTSDNRKPAELDIEQDFWSEHPANRDLPSDLSGDPFGDDP